MFYVTRDTHPHKNEAMRRSLLLLSSSKIASAFTSNHCTLSRVVHRSLSAQSYDENIPWVDRQSDEKYGRGIAHLSADISEGEIIAYQDGTWYVDGNEVGMKYEVVMRFSLPIYL